MKTWAESQREFMRAGGQTTKGFNEDQLIRYLDHVMEEAHETLKDWAKRDMTMVADGLADTIVVCMGAMLSMGLDPDDIMLAVLSANARKIVNGEVYRREDGQIGKPPGWYGPEAEIAEFIRIASHDARGIA